MKKLTVFLFLAAGFILVRAQFNYAGTLEKYANYRYRFNGDRLQKEYEQWGGETAGVNSEMSKFENLEMK